jgi:hypothetical protein
VHQRFVPIADDVERPGEIDVRGREMLLRKSRSRHLDRGSQIDDAWPCLRGIESQ